MNIYNFNENFDDLEIIDSLNNANWKIYDDSSSWENDDEDNEDNYICLVQTEDEGKVIIPYDIRELLQITDGDFFRIYVDIKSKTIAFKKLDTTINTHIVNDLINIYDKYIYDVNYANDADAKLSLNALSNLIDSIQDSIKKDI